MTFCSRLRRQSTNRGAEEVMEIFISYYYQCHYFQATVRAVVAYLPPVLFFCRPELKLHFFAAPQSLFSCDV